MCLEDSPAPESQKEIETEQRASLTIEEAKTIKDLLSSSQESMLQAEQKAQEAKLSYER